jgi:hypothetical protein
MLPSLSQAKQHVQEATPAFLPVAVALLSYLSATKTASRHSLFANSIAWLLVCTYHGARLGLNAGTGDARKQRLSWVAGLLYALAQVCDRAAADDEGAWWAKVGYILCFRSCETRLDTDEMTSHYFHSPFICFCAVFSIEILPPTQTQKISRVWTGLRRLALAACY